MLNKLPPNPRRGLKWPFYSAQEFGDCFTGWFFSDLGELIWMVVFCGLRWSLALPYSRGEENRPHLLMGCKRIPWQEHVRWLDTRPLFEKYSQHRRLPGRSDAHLEEYVTPIQRIVMVETCFAEKLKQDEKQNKTKHMYRQRKRKLVLGGPRKSMCIPLTYICPPTPPTLLVPPSLGSWKLP